jgi:hypothetical protein
MAAEIGRGDLRFGRRRANVSPPARACESLRAERIERKPDWTAS